ncbi:hypothetical protein SARC_10639 [Sphaeroforma arctica JP610]|uniref:Uncharacterized protein n=1 Tax=Sphaeroforma arctica JP610 TaxID=667725 RepID=A0A0L0FJC4_9EUKA|nr:hypothetical protein SARC_10639 [Sphaeroforma arctica JP610]KNC76887.1 hypothetical protein SARC_10639 [Sphaeroforma arctica JP610]|eukprot:XP_014150789.1 hypothetical protein SARC_10639 [Sphaeroforma arctica JP610]
MSEMKRNKRKMLDSGPKRRIMKAPEGMAIPKHQHKKQRLTAQQKRDLTKKRRTPKFDEAKEEEEEDIIAAQELLEGGFSENEMVCITDVAMYLGQGELFILMREFR